MSITDELNALINQIIAAAIAVHHEIGPGALESTYEACLAFELTERSLAFERQKALPVVYRGHTLDCGYRIDLLVEDKVIVEIKTVSCFEPVHIAQLISYLRLSRRKVGLLVNFHTKWLVRGGIRRVVNEFPR
jgi:GxxExxY protein